MAKFVVCEDFNAMGVQLTAGQIIDDVQSPVATWRNSGLVDAPYTPSSMDPVIAHYLSQRAINPKAEGDLYELFLRSIAGASIINTSTGQSVEQRLGAGGGGSGTSFVYQPGGVNVGNQFNTWAALYAAYQATQGPTFIQIDDSIVSPAVIPAGAYVFRPATTIVGRLIVPETHLRLADGVTFNRMPLFSDQLLIESVSSAPIYTVLPGEILPFVFERGAKIIANGTAPFIYNGTDLAAGGGLLVCVLRQGAVVLTGASPFVFLQDPLGIGPAVGIFVMFDDAIVQASTAASSGGVVLLQLQVDTTAGSFDYTQPGYSSVLGSINAQAQMRIKQYLPPVGGVVMGGPVTLADGQLTRVDPTGGGFTVSLPQAGQVIPGSTIGVKNVSASANPVVVDPQGGDTLDGLVGPGAFTIAAPYGAARFVSDGISAWMVV